MTSDERREIGARIAEARRASGLTQAGLAERLGVTTRTIQNYESGAVVPYRHLARIESIGGTRPGWLMTGETGDDDLRSNLVALHRAMEEHHALLRDHLEILRRQTELLREQREASERRRGGGRR